PLRGTAVTEVGTRFPDMSEPYKKDWIKKGQAIASDHDIHVHTGTYASIQGPNLETRAEYGYIRTIGADVIGMSTIPEVLAARQMDLPCFAISVITDEGFHEELEPVSIEMVIEAANKAEPKMTTIMKELIKVV
ncbi:MAG: purine-nucleoside phosphorylase, partial [Bacteroidetes bacterium SW_10_40_5]